MIFAAIVIFILAAAAVFAGTWIYFGYYWDEYLRSREDED